MRLVKEMKQRRADARRNEEKIIEAALVQFSKHGVHAPLDAIAKQAGVGAGTLYRHFPTRDHIIASALGACHLHFQDTRTSFLKSENALSALQEWLSVVREYVNRYEGLAVLLLDAVNDPDSALSSHCTELQQITEVILSRAQQAGMARSGVSARSLLVAQLALSCAECLAAGSSSAPDSLEVLLRDGYASPDPTSRTIT